MVRVRTDRQPMVAHLDLRTLPVREATAHVDGALAAALRGSVGDRPAQLVGVLAVDTEGGLARHRAAYEQILAGGQQAPLLCVALDDPVEGNGPGPWPRQHGWADGTAGPVLSRPALLRPPLAGTLWVRDVRGASAGAGAWSPADPAADEEALAALVELLCVPAVFERVLTVLRDMPEAVAGPSLRVLLYDLAEDTLRHAQTAALRRFAGAAEDPGRDPIEGRPLSGSLTVLAGDRQLRGSTDWRRRGGLAERLHEDAAAAVGAAVSHRDQVRRGRGLLDPATARLPAELAEAAAALDAYRSTVATALTDPRIAPRGPDGREAGLAALGVELAPDQEVSRARVQADLKEHTLALLDQRLPLRTAAAALAELSRRTAPTGTGHRLADLDRACPPELAARLAGRYPFRPAPGRPVLLAGVAVAALVAALPFGRGSGVAAGLLVTALALAGAVLVGARRPDRSGEVAPGGLLAPAGAGVVGTAVGAALAGPLSGPAPGAGPVLALLLLAWTTVRTWTAAVDGWTAAAGVDTAVGAAGRIERVLADAVGKDWVLSEARSDASNGAFALASFLRQAAATVDELAAATAPETRPGTDGAAARPLSTVSPKLRSDVPWLERGVGEGGPALVDTLVGDFCDATVHLLRPCWPVLLGGPDPVRQLRVEERVRDHLGESLRFGQRHGVGEAPPFARDPGSRPGPDALLGIGVDQVADALADLDDRAGLRPLCDSGQLRMLAHTAGDEHDIRFAPSSTRSRVLAAGGERGGGLRGFPGEPGWRDGADDTVWVDSGRYVGVLRLSPFTIGAVRTFQSRQDEDPDGVDSAAS